MVMRLGAVVSRIRRRCLVVAALVRLLALAVPVAVPVAAAAAAVSAAGVTATGLVVRAVGDDI